METRTRAVELLGANPVAGPPDVAQLGLAVLLVPERNRALLDHQEVRLVRLALPGEEFVVWKKAYAAIRRERHQVGVVNGVEWRVLFEEIRDAVADLGCVHAGPLGLFHHSSGRATRG